MKEKHAIIRSTGSYLPTRAVLNGELNQFPAVALPLIEQKTGIRQRHFAAPEQATSDLAVEAVRACLETKGIDPCSIDALLLATSSPDHFIPATAAIVQHKAGLSQAFACDINSVCSGALYAMHFADSLIRSGMHSRVLVVAAETYSRFLNPLDIASYPYFGDGAGAVLLEAGDTAKGSRTVGVISSLLYTDGAGAGVISIPGGGSRMPGGQCQSPSDFYFRMNGREVYKFAVSKGSSAIEQCLKAANIAKEDVDVVVTHQANINIINEIAQRTKICRDKFFVNLDIVGNAAAASVLIALDEAIRQEFVQPGFLVVLAAFGGGLSWGAVIIRV